MSFMEEQITIRLPWRFVVHNKTDDRFWCMADDLPKEPGYRIDGDIVWGYGARFSAPGYMDCTDWNVFETEEEAEQYFEDEREDE